MNEKTRLDVGFNVNLYFVDVEAPGSRNVSLWQP